MKGKGENGENCLFVLFSFARLQMKFREGTVEEPQNEKGDTTIPESWQTFPGSIVSQTQCCKQHQEPQQPQHPQHPLNTLLTPSRPSRPSITAFLPSHAAQEAHLRPSRCTQTDFPPRTDIISRTPPQRSSARNGSTTSPSSPFVSSPSSAQKSTASIAQKNSRSGYESSSWA